MLWSIAGAWAAPEPCYGHSQAERADSAHFWVEWPEGALREDQALLLLDAMETGRETWLEMGYGFTDEAVVAEIVELGNEGISGLTTTRPCGDRVEPFIQLYVGRWDSEAMVDVATHETAHAAQYADMGSYTDGVASWAWWMEGHATWMTPRADKQWDGWADTVKDYTDRLPLPLVHGVEGYLDGEAQRHMYGTTWVVHALAELVGEQAVRDTWTWGGPQAGTRLSFIDAVDAVSPAGFDAFWSEYLARLPTMQLDTRRPVDRPPRQRASGADDNGSDFGAAGLGVVIVQWPSGAASPDAGLEVSFDGGDVPWVVVLAATARGGALLEWVALDAADGTAEGWISRYDADLWLVASPRTDQVAAQPFSWRSSAVEARARMPGAVVLDPARSEVDEQAGACGCAHRTASGSAAAMAVLCVAVSRRRPRRSDRGR